MNYKRIIIRATIQLLLTSAFYSCDKSSPKTEVTTSPKVYPALKTSVTDFYTTMNAPGSIGSVKPLHLAFEISGDLDAILVKEGETFEQGKVLARINTDELTTQQKLAQQLVDDAQWTYDNTKALYEDSVATLEQFRNAESQLKSATTELNLYNYQLKNAQLIAPVYGTVVDITYNENEVIQAGSPVIEILPNNSSNLFKLSVTDKELLQIHIGDSAEVHFNAYPQTAIKGFVSYMAQKPDPVTNTYPIEITLFPAGKRLPQGMIGNANIQRSKQQSAIVIPIEALLEAEKVMVIENKVATARTITISAFSDSTLTIAQGLSPNEIVVLTGAKFIHEGDTVNYTIQP